MRTTLTRILASLAIAAFSVGPVSAATATNAATLVAQNATTGAVSGVARDETGAPIAGATVIVQGSKSYQTTTDAKGAFSLDSIHPGLYVISVRKAGYDAATQPDFAIFSGEVEKLTVTMHTQTFTSLRTIATVHSNGHGSSFNTSTAAVDVVSAATFVDQAQPQVGRILNQIPGVQNTLPTSSANGAVPGAITVPNVRGALSNETASLIDGHPLAVGDYGDYVSTFLNSFLLQDIEVIKGPGAMSPETNYAIGGTVNFRTKDPTLTPTPDYTIGVDNHGGTYYNFGISDTLGRLGFVVDLAGINDPTALDGSQQYFNVYGNNGIADWNGTSGINVSYNPTDSQNYAGNTNSKLYNQYSLLACCYTYSGAYNQTAELLKLRYKFSGATTATVSYLGGQTFADQNANTSELIPSTFIPGNAGYSGALAAGSPVNVPNSVYPQTAQEVNNEPIFQAEVLSLIGQDTVLARYYHASIDRLIYEGNPNPSTPVVGYFKLYGVNPSSSKACAATTCQPNIFNGQTVPMAFFDWYNQFEEDRLSGLSFEYQHQYGDANNLTFSVDQTNASSTAGSVSASFPNVVSGTNTYAPAATPTQAPSVSNPQGTTQLFTTFLLRNSYQFTPKLNATVALYDNLYQNTFPYACTKSNGAIGAKCLIDGSNALFTTNHNSHFDERIALEYRPRSDLALRFSAGSAIAPPYLSLLSKVTTPVSCKGTACTLTSNNPDLLPETAFGYDVGADFRFKDNATVFSVDGYLTDLYNHFLAETVALGTCGAPQGGVTCPTGSAGTNNIFESLNTNLSSARFEGIEFQLKRVVAQGLGFDLSGAVQHAYAYNLPPGFYCQNLPAGTPCTPANYNVNLPIIAGENFTGNTFGTLYNTGGTSSIGGSGFSNTSIPYFQGDFSVNYTTKGGIYGEFGETVYGKNNGYNLPPFGIAYATLRAPISNTVSLQVSGNNIFNGWTGLFPIVGGGIAYPLANGGTGATIGNTLGPATYTLQVTKTLP